MATARLPFSAGEAVNFEFDLPYNGVNSDNDND